MIAQSMRLGKLNQGQCGVKIGPETKPWEKPPFKGMGEMEEPTEENNKKPSSGTVQGPRRKSREHFKKEGEVNSVQGGRCLVI